MSLYQTEQQSDQPVIIENYRGPLLWTPAGQPENTDLVAAQPYSRPPDTRAYPGWSRWGGLAGMVGGLLWVILWMLESQTGPALGRYDPFNSTILGLTWDDYSRLTIIPTLLLLIAMTSFHIVQRQSYKALGWMGFIPMFLVYTLLGIGVLTPDTGGRYLWTCTFPIIMFSQIFWGITSYADGNAAKWASQSLIFASGICVMAMFISMYLIEVIFGLPWIVIGYAMWRDRNVRDGAGRVSVSHVSG